MREIKFRAWDINEKKYYYGVENQYDGEPVPSWSMLENDCFGSICKSNLFIVEQFTGLRDKNGKEIYEGDRCNILTSSGEYAIAHVVYCDGCFELWFIHPIVIADRYETRDYLKCSVVNHTVEVIGNIHGNSELLK